MFVFMTDNNKKISLSRNSFKFFFKFHRKNTKRYVAGQNMCSAGYTRRVLLDRKEKDEEGAPVKRGRRLSTERDAWAKNSLMCEYEHRMGRRIKRMSGCSTSTPFYIRGGNYINELFLFARAKMCLKTPRTVCVCHVSGFYHTSLFKHL